MSLVFRRRLIEVQIRCKAGRFVYVLNDKIQVKILRNGRVVFQANDYGIVTVPVLRLIVLEIRQMRSGKVQICIIASSSPIRIRGDAR